MRKEFKTVSTNIRNNLFNTLSWSSLSARMGSPKLTPYQSEQTYRPSGIFRNAAACLHMTAAQNRTYAAREMHRLYRYMSKCWTRIFHVGPK